MNEVLFYLMKGSVFSSYMFSPHTHTQKKKIVVNFALL